MFQKGLIIFASLIFLSFCSKDRRTQHVPATAENLSDSSLIQLTILDSAVKVTVYNDAHNLNSSNPNIYDTLYTVLDSSFKVSIKPLTFHHQSKFQKYVANTLINSIKELYDNIIGQKIIYCDDYRIDYYEENKQNAIRNADFVVGLFNKIDVSPHIAGNTALKTKRFNETINYKRLCNTERFYNRPQRPFCTGIAIGNNLFVTAGTALIVKASIKLGSYSASNKEQSTHHNSIFGVKY